MIHVARTWIKVFCPKMIFAVPGFAFQMHSTHLNYAHHKEKKNGIPIGLRASLLCF